MAKSVVALTSMLKLIHHIAFAFIQNVMDVFGLPSIAQLPSLLPLHFAEAPALLTGAQLCIRSIRNGDWPHLFRQPRRTRFLAGAVLLVTTRPLW